MNHPRRSLVAVALVGLLGACRSPDSDPTAIVGAPLAAGEARVGHLEGGLPLAYPIRLESGQALEVVADQQGIDVVLVLIDPRGREIVRVDGPSGTQGAEDLIAVAGRTGFHRLEVRPFARGASGDFSLEVRTLRPAGDADRRMAAAQRTAAKAARLALSDRAADQEEAAALYADATAAWLAVGHPAAAAETRLARARLLRSGGDLAAALPEFLAAAAAFHAAGRASLEGWANLGAGACRLFLGEPEAADAAYQSALDRGLAAADRRLEAAVRNDLGLLHERRGEFQPAFDDYHAALAIWRELADDREQAVTLHNLASTEVQLGRNASARGLLTEALARELAAGDRRAEATTRVQIGWLHFVESDLPAAMADYDEALAIQRRLGDRFGEAGTRDRRATALRALGRLDEAEQEYEHALRLARGAQRRVDEAHILCNQAELALARDDAAPAAALAGRALALFEQTADRHGAVAAQVRRARALRRLDRPAEAEALLEDAVRAIQTGRAALAPGGVRSTFLASYFDPVDELVDLLMDRERHEPGRGFRERALEAVEASRARTLGDRLAATPLTLGRIRREVLDDDTLLLIYSLGERRSFVWVVGHDLLEAREIASRARIDRLARDLADRLAGSRRPGDAAQARLAAAALAEAVLAPVASFLDDRRLAVVADSALLRVPFDVLPDPGGAGEPLLARREVVELPSASALAALRRRAAGRPPPTGELVVIADPVFGSDDDRFAGRSGIGDAETSSDGLQRLAHSAREAAAILALVPAGSTARAYLGFDASRRTVLGGGLRGFRIVHLAGHGVLHPGEPELSTLVFSRIDRQGNPLDGRVQVRELANIELPADLVVLSACRTARGETLRGEGVVGMSWAFLGAGARSVVASRWDVGDQATAELMTRFYRGLFHQGLAPAAALRQAELALRNDARWSAPADWAAFTLFGDWRRSTPSTQQSQEQPGLFFRKAGRRRSQ